MLNIKQKGVIFCSTFCVGLILTITVINKQVNHAFPQLEKRVIQKDYLKKVKDKVSGDTAFLVQKESASKAKAVNLFWSSDADSNGFGVNLFSKASAFDAIFPGYGAELRNDKLFWQDYFKLGFEPQSFIDTESTFSLYGFQVAYSWPGCFKIYQKYGADILVFGSSEVYKSLAPGQVARNLASAFANPPKVLYCVTAAMPVEAVQTSIMELLRVSTHKPKLIIWGYSFWLAYTKSSKLADYRKDKEQEFQHYWQIQAGYPDGSASVLPKATVVEALYQLAGLKLVDYFPKISWDDVLPASLDKFRGLLQARKNTKAEGLEISDYEFALSDVNLRIYLDKNLLPYYALSSGVTNVDCSMVEAEAQIDQTVKNFKLLTSNIYIYVPPTSHHHRQTVPPCFLPKLNNVMRHVANKENIHFFDKDIEIFKLNDRDFISPLSGDKRFFFDINHTNFEGSKKVVDTLTPWILSTTPHFPENKN